MTENQARKKLKAWRADLGLTQVQMAEKLAYKYDYYRKVEAGHHPLSNHFLTRCQDRGMR